MNSKPKLLVVCRSFGVPSEIWISRQIESFDAFDTAVLCWNRVQGGTQANVPVEELGTDFDAPERSPARWLRRLLSRPSGNMRGAWGSERKQLIERTQRLEPDVVLCHFGHTALRFLPAAEALGIPVVAHFHGLDLSSSLQDRYYRWSLERRIHRFAHMVVVGSHQQRKLCELGARPERISRIPCGAPASAFLPSTRHTSSCCRFIMVSRLVAWKGPDLTLRAFARARQSQPNMELHVVGTGPTRRASATREPCRARRSNHCFNPSRFMSSTCGRWRTANAAARPAPGCFNDGLSTSTRSIRTSFSN
ncbi:MAG TPA: glycosyltransferase family 4 protein [Verrucomicrobia bacterium]|nr:glycosyltransferase family 4 protein [Verrucomicrobiota bacterium]